MPAAAGLYSQGRDRSSGLTKRQREVLEALTGDPPLSQNETALRLGLSRQRVRQIVETLLDKGFPLEGVKPRKEPND